MDATPLGTLLEPIFRKHEPVVLAYLFGSVARGDTHEGSDLDLAVLVTDTSLRFYRTLWADLHDALGPRAFDLVTLNSADPVLCFEVLREGKLLFCRSAEELNAFEQRAWNRYQDTRHLRAIGDRYLQERAKAWSSSRKRSASA